MIKEFKIYISYFIMIININPSVVIDGILGIIISVLIIFTSYLLFLDFKK